MRLFHHLAVLAVLSIKWMTSLTLADTIFCSDPELCTNSEQQVDKKQYMRFGRGGVSGYMRFGRSVDSNDGDGQPPIYIWTRNDPFLRFGKRGDPFLRFGKGDPFLRFGKQDPFLRFGRNDPFLRFGRGDPFLRFGKNDPFLRFGKSDPFLRFGKSDPFLRFGKNDPILRFGRQDPFLRFGRQDPFLRFGKRSDEELGSDGLDVLSRDEASGTARNKRSTDAQNDEVSAAADKKNFMRFGRSSSDDMAKRQYMRFGRSDATGYMRFGRSSFDDADDTAASFGRTMRFRPYNQKRQYMRFGKSVDKADPEKTSDSDKNAQ